MPPQAMQANTNLGYAVCNNTLSCLSFHHDLVSHSSVFILAMLHPLTPFKRLQQTQAYYAGGGGSSSMAPEPSGGAGACKTRSGEFMIFFGLISFCFLRNFFLSTMFKDLFTFPPFNFFVELGDCVIELLCGCGVGGQDLVLPMVVVGAC